MYNDVNILNLHGELFVTKSGYKITGYFKRPVMGGANCDVIKGNAVWRYRFASVVRKRLYTIVMDSDHDDSHFSDAAIDSERESSAPHTSSGTASRLPCEHSDDSGELCPEPRHVAPYSFEPSDSNSDDAGSPPSATSDDDAEDRLADLSW